MSDTSVASTASKEPDEESELFDNLLIDIVFAISEKNQEELENLKLETKKLTEGKSYQELDEFVHLVFDNGGFFKEKSINERIQVAKFFLENIAETQFFDKKKETEVCKTSLDYLVNSTVARNIIEATYINSTKKLEFLEKLYPKGIPKHLIFPSGDSISPILLAIASSAEDKDDFILNLIKNTSCLPTDSGKIRLEGFKCSIIYEAYLLENKHLEMPTIFKLLIEIDKHINAETLDEINFVEDLDKKKEFFNKPKTLNIYSKNYGNEGIESGIFYSESNYNNLVWAIVLSKRSINYKIESIANILRMGYGQEAFSVDELEESYIHFEPSNSNDCSEVLITDAVTYVLEVLKKECVIGEQYCKKEKNIGKEIIAYYANLKSQTNVCETMLLNHSLNKNDQEGNTDLITSTLSA